MKIFQIEDNMCRWDASRQVSSLEYAKKNFPANLLFVEAPDYVFEGWGYIQGEFIQPTPPEGWLYDKATGTFYKNGDNPPSPPEPTETELLGQQITDEQLERIEMGQAYTDLELALLE